mmetsp:Transcript_27173/g.63209  ORF Transcript_27173/g.63209 Transcript_27173/m.63209 type:complete len:431 (-) Transcript_27173:243-1535(-)|eukprot:CAMPEP_0178438452 /NCGR_PEP_ID=MMETSP0689_2-20121128/35600_1 /TAXON_ID=160604 /ORGANISM="Amphidinium massartii, Strain CS-259" /LENGTH=430 /DNA_ID=CAMNT_0020060855 /DNA_START=7 /DNA_END=1299 /DNA_ORIENTATION=-
MESHCVTAVLIACFLVGRTAALDNGLGLLPPMGYNTWNDQGCILMTEGQVKAAADALVSSGLNRKGYIYVNLDDCWHDRERDNITNRLRADPLRFPSGIPGLAAYVHSKGLKFGIYTDRGSKTCAGRPGSLGYEKLDAETFASWGVDYVKEDNCHSTTGPNDEDVLFEQFGLFRDALNATGRPIFFSVCGGGDQTPWANLSYYASDRRGGPGLANAWRISPDCTDWITCSNAAHISSGVRAFAAQGGYNDPDMLMSSTKRTARLSLTPHQSRTQFFVWAVLMAPLLLGSSPAELSAYDLETYGAEEVIKVNQDPLLKQGGIITSEWDTAGGRLGHIVWAREVTEGVAMVFQNNFPVKGKVTCSDDCWAALPFARGTHLHARELLPAGSPDGAMQDLAPVAGTSLAVDVVSGGASRMFLLSPQSDFAPVFV